MRALLRRAAAFRPLAVVLAVSLVACQAAPQTAQRGTATTPPAWAPERYVSDGGPSAPATPPPTCRITRIVDGDTVHCDPLGRIRLIGIDSPEREQDVHFRAASDAIGDLIPVGTEVWAEEDREERDRFDRPLRYLWVGGDGPDRMVNWMMIRSGHAVELTYRPNDRYQAAFQAAEEAARVESAGLWATGGFECRPVDDRRGVCP